MSEIGLIHRAEAKTILSVSLVRQGSVHYTMELS